MISSLKKYFGPSMLITAAFIGPGTLTVCTIAGYELGYELLWVLLFAIFTTVVLQEMSARVGLKTQQGLAQALQNYIPNKVIRISIIVLLLAAILVGNTAYESGNIAGAGLGLSGLFGDIWWFPIIIGILAIGLLSVPSVRYFQMIISGIVILMVVCFLIAVCMIGPSYSNILSGIMPSSISSDSILKAVALVGTTVVPYNLFLHASLISEKYDQGYSLQDLRIENMLAVFLGGLISILILIVAAETSTMNGGGSVKSIMDLATLLNPSFGEGSLYIISIGLLAAGLSSAITAPLAAAYVGKEVFSLSRDSWYFKSIWIVIILIGVIISLSGYQPILIIKFAQVANGVILPLLAGILIWMTNQKSIVGKDINSLVYNGLALLVLIVTIFISLRAMHSVFGIFQ